MARGISWGGTSLPVTDASISSSREPLIEQSMSGLGGEILYGGVYGAAQGSFGGAYRHTDFSPLIAAMLTADDSDADAAVIVWDDHGNALTCATTYITSVEISCRAGELAKCTFNFVGQKIEAGTAGSAAVYTNPVAVFYKSSTTWGAASEFTLKIERPYSADDYIIGNDQFYSQSIYQGGDTKVSGTVKFAQTTAIPVSDPAGGNITIVLGEPSASHSITITGAVLSNIEMGISGRGLISKTKAWACPSTGISGFS